MEALVVLVVLVEVLVGVLVEVLVVLVEVLVDDVGVLLDFFAELVLPSNILVVDELCGFGIAKLANCVTLKAAIMSWPSCTKL